MTLGEPEPGKAYTTRTDSWWSMNAQCKGRPLVKLVQDVPKASCRFRKADLDSSILVHFFECYHEATSGYYRYITRVTHG